jgi:chorismate mutase
LCAPEISGHSRGTDDAGSLLCRAIDETLASPSKLRLALRRRLERLLRDSNLAQRDREHVHDLIERSRANARENPSVRPYVEALLSAVFEYLQPLQQQSIIETWIDRGTRGAAARWLKATTRGNIAELVATAFGRLLIVLLSVRTSRYKGEQRCGGESGSQTHDFRSFHSNN